MIVKRPNFKHYFIYALIIKAVLFLSFAFLFNKNSEADKNIKYIFNHGGDFNAYMAPVMNLVDKGVYYESDEEKRINLCAAKMPGMLPVFGPLYYLFGFEWGLFVLIILQYVIDALCCVLLGKIAIKIFKSSKSFYLAFFIYSFSTIVSVGSHYANSEFFCTSFSIIAIYFALHYQNHTGSLLAGLFTTWSLFFRPSSILLFIFIPFFLFMAENKRLEVKFILKNKMRLLIFIIPFLIFEGMWVGRNYLFLKRVIPLDISLENFGSPGMRSVFTMLRDLGGDLQAWVPESEMRWFNDKLLKENDSSYLATFPFPEYVLKAGISKSEMLEIRNDYYFYQLSLNSKKEVKELERSLDSKTKLISKKFKENSPLAYYILAPLRTLKMLVFINRPYGFTFNNHGIFEKLVRAWHFSYYYFTLTLFFFGCIWTFARLNKEAILIVLLVLSHCLLYGFVLRFTENRYLVPMHPCIVLISVGALLFFIKGVSNRFGLNRKLKV